MQKEAVIWTYIYFSSIKQYNLVSGNPSPTLHRSPWLWPDQHYWNNLTRITPANSFGNTCTVLFSCYSYPVAFNTCFGSFYCIGITEFLSAYLQDKIHVEASERELLSSQTEIHTNTFEISSLVQPAAYSVMQCCPIHCRCASIWHSVNPWHWDWMMEDYQGFFISEIAKTSFELYYGWGKKKKKRNPCRTVQNNLDLILWHCLAEWRSCMRLGVILATRWLSWPLSTATNSHSRAKKTFASVQVPAQILLVYLYHDPEINGCIMASLRSISLAGVNLKSTSDQGRVCLCPDSHIQFCPFLLWVLRFEYCR